MSELSYESKAFFTDTAVMQFFAAYGLPVPKTSSFYRMTPAIVGQINGIPASRGVLRVTDGLTAYIELGDGSLFKGHAEWFVADDLSVNVKAVIATPSKAELRDAELAEKYI